MKKHWARSLTVACLAVGAVYSLPASATLTGISCNTADVKVTTIKQYSADGATLNTLTPAGFMADSAYCAGAFVGNDGFYPQQNLGIAGDGLLNGGVQVQSGQVLFPNPPGAFINAPSTLSDLDGDGQANDPGWIMLGKYEDNGPNGSWVFTPSAIGGDSSVVLSSFFSVSFANGYSGSWAFTLDADVVSRASVLLGANYFDQFALVFKSSDAFAAYDFTADQFGITPSASDPVYQFFGTFDTSSTLLTRSGRPAGLSHITLWARDPAASNVVPEPGMLGLFGVAMLGLFFLRRRVAK